MKKLISTIIIALLPILAMAQIQQGHVKTKGRLNSNGTVTSGKRLSGATITIKKGNSAVSNSKGEFSINTNSKNYTIQSVKKNGYVLTDPEILSKTYTYSTNPLIISMETPDEQLELLLENTDKIRATLADQLNKKKKELAKLKEKNKITHEKYLKLRQQINDEQNKNEKLISEMAERYSKIDYDLIDDFDREFNQYILNGELTKADSLLNTKGDINSRINELHQEKEAIDKEEKELAQRQDNLEKGKAYYNQQLEDIANDCYKKYERFRLEYQNDSAAYYLELRASLDTTNVDWQLEVGSFISNYIANYDKALEYYNRALRNALTQHGESHPDVATSYYNIGYIYSKQGNFDEALNFYQKALGIWLQLYGETHPDVASSYNNIGGVYLDQGNYDEALNFYQKALEIFLQVYGESHPNVATSYNNIGNVYYYQGNYDEALNYYHKDLKISLQVYGENHPSVATSYNNIGLVYSNQGNYDEALNYHQKALEIRLQIFDENHPDVANSYNNIGLVYTNQGNHDEALNYYQKALTIRLQVLGENHPDVASSYNNIGAAYFKQGNYTEVLNYFHKALDIYLQVYGESHPDVASSYYNIGGEYYTQGNIDEALNYVQKALEIWLQVYGESHPNVVLCRNAIYSTYCNLIKQNSSYMPDFLKFMENIAFIATMDYGDTPASKQGLKGEYYLFEFGDWNMESLNCLWNKNVELRGMPKTLVLMKDGKISSHYFENSIGCQFGVKWVSKEDKQQILEQYHKWKKNNK